MLTDRALRHAAFAITTVALSAPLAGQASLPRTRGVETLRIAGSVEDLSNLAWLVGFPDGRIAAGLPVEGVVRWYGPDGKKLGDFGRRGEGPGEFRSPLQGGRAGDTLWTLDRQLGRLTMVRPGAFPLRGFFSIPSPGEVEGTLGGKHPLVGSVTGVLEGRRFLFQVSELDSAVVRGAERVSRLVITDSVGRLQSVLPWADSSGRCTVPYTSGKTVGSVGVMFCAKPILSVSSTGDRIVRVTADNSSATTSTFAVAAYAPTGALLSKAAFRVPAVPIPKRIADSIQAGMVERARSAEARAARKKAKIPPSYPPVIEVVVADDGDIWLAVPGGDSLRTWMVLDARGIRRGTVLLPKQFFLSTVLKGSAIGREYDDDGFVDIVRYRVGSR